MIFLFKNVHFAEGLSQICYVDPTSTDLSIKIIKEDIDQEKVYNEYVYYKKVSKRKKQYRYEYPFFAKYHGEITTNLGQGFVFDLIRDEDTNSISKTLDYYLLRPTTAMSDRMMQNAFDRLIELMGKYKIMAYDIQSNNICCKILKDGNIECILIDGLGHRDFFPLVDYFSFFAKKKIARRLKKNKITSIEESREYKLKEKVNYH